MQIPVIFFSAIIYQLPINTPNAYTSIDTPNIPDRKIITQTELKNNRKEQKDLNDLRILSIKNSEIRRDIKIISFKCPTELVNIETPSSKLFHGVINNGFEIINGTKILPFDLIQVCN